MSSKHIIELGEDANMVQVISVTQSGNAYVDSTVYVGYLEQLNSDYINEHYGDLQDTAYQRGFDDGKVQGQNEAWNCAKRICLHPHNGGMTCTEISNAFGEASATQVLYKCSAQQAIEKLKAYEKKQADKIGAGDVVKTYNGITYVVTKATIDGIVVGFDGEGDTCRFALSEVTNTGKHYNINEILGGLCDD